MGIYLFLNLNNEESFRHAIENTNKTIDGWVKIFIKKKMKMEKNPRHFNSNDNVTRWLMNVISGSKSFKVVRVNSPAAEEREKNSLSACLSVLQHTHSTFITHQARSRTEKLPLN